MLRKRYVIECINDLLKNKANIVHSRPRSIQNFIMNVCTALTAYSFFENKPEALPVHLEKKNQLNLFYENFIPNLRITDSLSGFDRENLHLLNTKVEVSNEVKPMSWLAKYYPLYLIIIKLFKIKQPQILINFIRLGSNSK